MSARAGILVTGTEVLTGRVADRNGPWLADRLEELGVDLAQIAIVGDRRADMLAALGLMAAEGLDVVVTSGGLGPTADDLTAEVVGGFQGRAMLLDEALEERIAAVLANVAKRWPDIDMEAVRASNRKQAVVPEGATILEPVGTAPGLVVPPQEGGAGPTIVVLPGPPRELRAMWDAALGTAALRKALAGAVEYRRRMLRLFGIPESEIAETLRAAERAGVALERLEITTCLRRGEVEVVTRYEPQAQAVHEAFVEIVRERHARALFSEDGRSVDELLAAMLRGGALSSEAGAATTEVAGTNADRPRATPGPARGLTIATAESCTGGLLAARLTELAGASAYVRGAIVAYDNAVKVEQVGVPEELIERHGAVSVEVARALADGARARLGADVGVGVTGVAGPGGGTEAKPVGLVCLSAAGPGGAALTRAVNLPGGRADVRERATTVALHLVRRLLLGERDG